MKRTILPLPEMGADVARPSARRPSAKSALRVQNAATEDAELYIYGEIGFWGITAQDVAGALQGITASTLHVRINSPGGDVFDGVAIYNLLLRFSGRVVVHVDGVAASAASIIALAGEEVLMAEASWAMIHRAWACACGPSGEMRRVAELLDKVDANLAGIYSRQMEITPEAAIAMMDAETWLTAAEAVAQGFADALEERPAVEAAFDFSLFKNTPDRLAAARGSARGSASKPQTVRELEAVLRDAGYSRSEATRIAASGFDTTAPTRDESAALDLSPLADLATVFRSHSQR